MQKLLIFFVLGLCVFRASAQDHEQANYDESKVPEYHLPDPLKFEDGNQVKDLKDWQQRRSEILDLFRHQVYGKIPGELTISQVKTMEASTKALNGTAIRKQVRVYFDNAEERPYMDILIFIPKGEEKPVPMFLGLNFYGNQTIHTDPAILISDQWMRNNEDFGIVNNRATEASRGVRVNRWPVEMIIKAGYGLATIYYGDLDPDYENFQDGLHPLLYKSGQTKPKPDEWGSIAAWAAGLSKAVDYFESDPDIDQQRIILMGHSRLGKAALWAGALDQRFAIVISNNSGCGGAALSRRKIGETVNRINQQFPHWFCDNFNQYNNQEEALPIDQHQLIALMAPRPVYIASAVDDRWADPKGEFLAGKHASPVYQLHGLDGMPVETIPDLNQPVMEGYIGYHIRTGGHDVKEYDWQQFIKFANRHLNKKNQ